jgi:hypothetical protein
MRLGKIITDAVSRDYTFSPPPRKRLDAFLHRPSILPVNGCGVNVFFALTGKNIAVISNTKIRDVAQSGSAPEWGSGGREFKSRRPDHLIKSKG